MFTRRSVPQRTALLTVALSTAVVLAWTGPAAADPPNLNVDPCAQELAKAGQWPGGDSSGHRYFSDAYDSYLGRQPACSPGN
jgi:hypothetical protein